MRIPVLGDAELIAVLSASCEAAGGDGQLNRGNMGAIGTAEVKLLVERLVNVSHLVFDARRKNDRC